MKYNVARMYTAYIDNIWQYSHVWYVAGLSKQVACGPLSLDLNLN